MNIDQIKDIQSHSFKVDGVSNTTRVKIEREVKKVYQFGAHLSGRAHATQQEILKNTVRLYTDLELLGYSGLRIENLRSVHLAALINCWRFGVVTERGAFRKKISRATAANMWTVARRWVEILGKKGMAGDFHEVWPPELDAAPKPTPVTRTEGSSYTRAGLIHRISEDAYLAVISAWRDTPAKQMLYWIVRTAREFEIDIRAALRLEPYQCSQRIEGKLILLSWKGREHGMVGIDSQAKVELVANLIEFTDRLKIKRLCWDKAEVMTIEAGVRRVNNALSYQLKLFEAKQAAGNETDFFESGAVFAEAMDKLTETNGDAK